MRYAPPGLVLNDFAVLVADDGWHLLHLQAAPVVPFEAHRQETSYGHAFSTDLVRWKPLGPVFGVGRPGRFDDGAIWTMSTTAHPDGGLAMLYTGVSNTPHPATQAIGLARSLRRDGTGWLRVGCTPVCSPDPRWYRTDVHQAWRDPFVVRDEANGEWVCFIAAREARLDPAAGGCIAAAVSTDLQTWRVLPPAIPGGEEAELECPVVEWIDGRWVMFVCVSTDHSVRTYSAAGLHGPWSLLGRLGPPGIYAPRVVRKGHEALVLHTVQRRTGLHDQGELARGMLAQPKRLGVDADGVPTLRWWPATASHAAPPTSQPVHDAVIEVDIPDRARTVTLTLAAGTADAVEIQLAGGCARIGYGGGRVLQETSLGGGRADCRRRPVAAVTRPAQVAPVAVSGSGSAAAAATQAGPPEVGASEVRAADVGAADVGASTAPIQADDLLIGHRPPMPHHLRVLVVGEFHEVYADDTLILSTTAYMRGSGRPAAWADDRALPVSVRPLPPMYPDRDDVSAI